MAGFGSIKERKNPKTGKSYNPKRWVVTVSCGSDPVTGKRRRVVRTVRGTMADARKECDKIRRESEGGLSVDGARITFAEFASRWHENRISTGAVSEGVLVREREQINTMLPYIGDVRLRDLDAQAIETLYATIKQDKIAELGSYSGSTMKNLHGRLKQILAKAVDYDLIIRNPCDRVEAPKSEPCERRSLTQEEAAHLLAYLDEAEKKAFEEFTEQEGKRIDRGVVCQRRTIPGLGELSYLQAVRIALATGMREGEVFGLAWGCVDFKASCIKVRQTLTYNGKMKEPKSKAGNRTISIDGATLEHLKAWQKRQAIELQKLGISQKENTLVCCSVYGGVVMETNFFYWWKQFRKAAGFPDLKFHELRHTQATLLLANGVDVKTVQTRLGHATASMTLDFYAHAIPQNDEKAAKTIGDLFAEAPKEAEVIDLKRA